MNNEIQLNGGNRFSRLTQDMNPISAQGIATPVVFLLDDDPSVLKATSRLLSSVGLESETFTDPHAFLDQVESQRPRAVVIDIWMPLMSGLEVQERVRSVSPSTQVIVLTSKDDPSVRSKALDGGARAFFLKQVDDDALLAGLTSAIDGK